MDIVDIMKFIVSSQVFQYLVIKTLYLVYLLQCEDKVPWINGKPDKIIKLDDKSQLAQNGITLDDNLSKADYYMHIKDCKWVVVERKDQPARIEKAIEQIRSTIIQFRKIPKDVHDIIVVGEKIDIRERKIFGIDNQSKELYLKSSDSKRVPVEGMNLKFYTLKQVDEMRKNSYGNITGT
jgi:hypothetical protein